MKGLLGEINNSKRNLQNAISKTKDKNLKKELEKNLKYYKNICGVSYYL